MPEIKDAIDSCPPPPTSSTLSLHLHLGSRSYQIWYNMRINMSKGKPMEIAAKVPQVRYSAAYPMGAELIVKVTPFVLILQKWQTARPRDERIASEL